MLDDELQTRRKLLKSTAVGFGHLALTALLATRGDCGFGESACRENAHTFPLEPSGLCFLFMKGGPSHVDTFDPKPLLDRDHGKPLPFDLPRVTFAKQGNLLKSPWRFQQYGESGLPVSELFPTRREARRRPVHSAFGARHQSGSWRRIVETAHRQRPVCATRAWDRGSPMDWELKTKTCRLS